MQNGNLINGAWPGVKSIQRGTITINGAASNTATITAVDTANSVLRLLGFTVQTAVNDDHAFARVSLTNATTVTAQCAVAPGTNVIVSYEVIEFYPGAIKSIQRGTIALAGATPVTATITSVDTTKAELRSLGFSSSNGAPSSTVQTSLVLTNATTVTASSVGTGANQTVSYEVVEYY